MSGVDPSGPADCLSEKLQFLYVGRLGGGVEHTRAHADGAFIERFLQPDVHLLALGGRGGPSKVTDTLNAQSGVTHQGSDVHAWRYGLNGTPVAGEGVI